MKPLQIFCKKTVLFLLSFCMLFPTFSPALALTYITEKTEVDSTYMTSTDWIWSTDKITHHSISYFRKELSLKKTVSSISVMASAHNHLKFYINGNIITGYVSPAPASLPENVNFLSYSFSGAALDKVLGNSKNKVCFAAACQYMGYGGENYINGSPAFWTEIQITYSDGSTEKVVSDTSWRALSKTPYANKTPSQNNTKTNMQLDYDATKMPGDPLAWTKFGYNEASYTDGEWKNAVAAAEETKTWKMRLQNIPEGAVHENITPKKAGKQETGWQVFDAGRIVTGWVKITASAPAGTKIYIRYEEDLDGDVVSHKIASEGASPTENYGDYYTFSGEGVETFVADFDYKAFRYFEVIGFPGTLEPENLTVQWASTGMEQIAQFSSSDEFLTKLYQSCINTQINNVIGMPVDCPHREQSQYLADSQLQFALMSYAFREFSEISYKTLLDFATLQKKGGRFAFVSPGERLFNKPSIPEWDLRYSAMLYQFYRTSGDLQRTAEFYDNAAKNVNYYLKMLDKNGLLRDEEGAWNISDHPMVKHVPDDPGSDTHPTVVNLLLYDSLHNLSKIATLLKKDEEAADWSQKAAALRTAINSTLLNQNTGLYLHHSGTRDTNPGVTAMAINVGVAEPKMLEKQIKAISRSSVMETSIVLTYELFRAIMEHGNSQQKEYVYKRMVTSWGPMVKLDFQTVWEGFKNQSSHSHAWSGYPAWIMLKDFLGVEYTGTKYSGTSIIPFLPSAVDQISGTVTNPVTNKAIEIELARNEGYQLSVTAPAEETILVAVPRVPGVYTKITADSVVIFEDGKGQNTSEIEYMKDDADYVYFNVKGQGKKIQFVSTASEGITGEITLDIALPQGGVVKVNGQEITAAYSASFPAGESVTLKASPSEGFFFVGWSGSVGSLDDELTLVLTRNTTLQANFADRSVETPELEEIPDQGEGDGGDSADTQTPIPSSSAEPSLSGGSNALPVILSLLVVAILGGAIGLFLYRSKKSKKQ